MENSIIGYTKDYINSLQMLSGRIDKDFKFTIVLPDDLYFKLELELNNISYFRSTTDKVFRGSKIVLLVDNGIEVEFKKK